MIGKISDKIRLLNLDLAHPQAEQCTHDSSVIFFDNYGPWFSKQVGTEMPPIQVFCNQVVHSVKYCVVLSCVVLCCVLLCCAVLCCMLYAVCCVLCVVLCVLYCVVLCCVVLCRQDVLFHPIQSNPIQSNPSPPPCFHYRIDVLYCF